MGGLTPGHLIILLVIVMVVVGPGKLPELGSALGKSIREFQKAAGPMKDLADPAKMLGLGGSPAEGPQAQPVMPVAVPMMPVAQPLMTPNQMAMPQQLPPMYAPQAYSVAPQAEPQIASTPTPTVADPAAAPATEPAGNGDQASQAPVE